MNDAYGVEDGMKNTLHIPTLAGWLYNLSQLKDPTNYQLEEAWQIAQTLAALAFPEDQRALDDIRRAIVSALARTENEWSRPRENLQSHTIIPSAKRLKHWTEIDLTPELSWSIGLAGRTVPSALVKKLRVALGRQHTNLKRLMATRGRVE
jgi:hypothetical protein